MSRSLAALLFSVIVLSFASTAAAATAGGYHGVVVDIANKVSVNYDHCYNDSGPLPCLTPTFNIANHSKDGLYCTVKVPELGDFVVFSTYVAAGSTMNGGSFTTGYTGQKALTINITCDDSKVAHSQTVYVTGG